MIFRYVQFLLLIVSIITFGSVAAKADEYGYIDAWNDLIENDFYPPPNGQLLLSTEKANLEHFEIGIEFNEYNSKINYYRPEKDSLLNQVKYIFDKKPTSTDVENIAKEVFFEKKSFDIKLCSDVEGASRKLIGFVFSYINSFDSNKGNVSINDSKFKPSKNKAVLDGDSYLVTLRIGEVEVTVNPEVTSEIGQLYSNIISDVIKCSKEVKSEKIYLSDYTN